MAILRWGLDKTNGMAQILDKTDYPAKTYFEHVQLLKVEIHYLQLVLELPPSVVDYTSNIALKKLW